MHKLLLLVAACALWACSSGSNSSAGTADGGAGDKDAASAGADDDASAEPGSAALIRPPGTLERPSQRLPADLRPPKE